VRTVFWENNQIHTGQTLLHTDQHLTDFSGIIQHFSFGVQAWHFVVYDGYADAIFTAGDIPVSHDYAPLATA
jgi:hypothetical protein